MRRLLLTVALCVALHAVAEVRVCMGGNLDHMSAAEQKACSERVHTAQTANYGKAVKDWHLVVVCDEDGWKDYVAFSGHEATDLATAAADKDPATRTIFLRGSRISSSQAVSEVVDESVVAHDDEIELAQK